LVHKAGQDSEEPGEPNPTFVDPFDLIIPVFAGDNEKNHGRH